MKITNTSTDGARKARPLDKRPSSKSPARPRSAEAVHHLKAERGPSVPKDSGFQAFLARVGK